MLDWLFVCLHVYPSLRLVCITERLKWLSICHHQKIIMNIFISSAWKDSKIAEIYLKHHLLTVMLWSQFWREVSPLSDSRAGGVTQLRAAMPELLMCWPPESGHRALLMLTFTSCLLSKSGLWRTNNSYTRWHWVCAFEDQLLRIMDKAVFEGIWLKKRLRNDFNFSLNPHSLFPYYFSLQDHILLLRGVDQIHFALIVTSLHMGIMCVSWFTFLPHTLDLLETWPMLYIAFEPVHCYYDYVGSIKTESGNLVT